jgi:hypothetical protein
MQSWEIMCSFKVGSKCGTQVGIYPIGRRALRRESSDEDHLLSARLQGFEEILKERAESAAREG